MSEILSCGFPTSCSLLQPILEDCERRHRMQELGGTPRQQQYVHGITCCRQFYSFCEKLQRKNNLQLVSEAEFCKVAVGLQFWIGFI